MRHRFLYRYRLMACACLAFQATLAAQTDTPSATDTAAARAQQCLETLQTWYNQETGRWATTSWWNAGNAVTAIIHYTQLTGDKQYLPIIENTFERCKKFTVDDDPDNPPWVCSNFINAWYDDEGWWILAWIDAYDLTGDSKYLEMARVTFADMTQGWDDVCGGGVYWKKPNIGKHSITNGLFLLSALRLEQHGGGSVNGNTYRQWADMTWNWFKDKQLINDDGRVENGLTQECRLETGAFYTYNQGIVIASLLEYRLLTGDQEYLGQAKKIADATLRQLTNQDGVLKEYKEPDLTGDSAQFKGIFLRYFRRLYEATHNAEYGKFIQTNAKSLWNRARNGNTTKIGGLWTGPFDQADAARQSSALDALNAAIAVAKIHDKEIDP